MIINPNLVHNLDPYLGIIKDVSNQTGIDEAMIGGIIMRETRGNTFALRYEPKFEYTYMPASYSKKLMQSLETEVMSQHCSFGLMQIMGCVARECGFDGYLTQLCDPAIGIYFGAKQLVRLFKTYPTTILDVISSYNAGSARMKDGFYSNQDYVNEVSYWMGVLKK